MGMGPLMELATLREYAEPMNPDVVLWFYYEGNDLRGLVDEKQNSILMKYLEDENFTQNLIQRQPEITEHLKRIADDKINVEVALVERKRAVTDKLPFFDFLTLHYLRALVQLRMDVFAISRRQETIVSKVDLELFRKILVVANDGVEAWGGKLYFVYLPQWKSISDPDFVQSHRDQVLALMRELHIPVVDIYEEFTSREDPLLFYTFRLNNHYNEQGYRVVAYAVLRSIWNTRGGVPDGG